MAVLGRSDRDTRRRRLGQNFLSEAAAERIVAGAEIKPGELILDVGAGRGVFAFAAARLGARVVAIEADPDWSGALRQKAASFNNVRVDARDFFALSLPREPFRVIGSPPFGRTTDILHRLLDDPRVPLMRADLVLQWEVARKRAAQPPDTLVSTQWAPWWEMRLAGHIPAHEFRPIPKIDAGLLVIKRRAEPVLPPRLAPAFAHFVRTHWPFS